MKTLMNTVFTISMSAKRVMLSYLFQIEIRKTIRECFGILSTMSPTQSMSSTSTQVNLRDGLYIIKPKARAFISWG